MSVKGERREYGEAMGERLKEGRFYEKAKTESGEENGLTRKKGGKGESSAVAFNGRRNLASAAAWGLTLTGGGGVSASEVGAVGVGTAALPAGSSGGTAAPAAGVRRRKAATSGLCLPPRPAAAASAFD